MITLSAVTGVDSLNSIVSPPGLDGVAPVSWGSALAEFVQNWVPRQRWFKAEDTGRTEPKIVGGATLGEDILWLLVQVGPELYNVPLQVVETGAEQAPQIIDATETDSGRARLLREVVAQPGEVSESKKFSGEQSNTSMVFKRQDAPAIILKLIRVVHAGKNPDVELPQALDRAGSGVVPHFYGSSVVRAPFLNDPDFTADALVATEFMEGARDAWQEITDFLRGRESSESGGGAPGMRQLGEMTRKMHRDLAAAFPTVVIQNDDRDAIVSGWVSRLEKVADLSGDVAGMKTQIRNIYTAAARVPWPNLQRIHGDYHLGQVLLVPQRGWVALDFEGEPLRPLSQRIRADLALRDVAGMLRSLSYAAGFARQQGAEADQVKTWERTARREFLDGYFSLGPDHTPETLDEDESSATTLLQALTIDKALYEVEYELRYRPDWVSIPLEGLHGLLD